MIEARLHRLTADTWALAERCYEFEEIHGWIDLGQTFEEWLAQPELAAVGSRTDFYRKKRLWEKLVVDWQVPPVVLSELAPSKAELVLPAVEDGKVRLDTALSDVKALSRSDLREKYRGNPGDETLDASKEPERVKCPFCGGWTTEDVIEGTGREMTAECEG